MARPSPDMHRRLQDPSEARKYIDSFDWGPIPKPKCIVLTAEKSVPLEGDQLSDEDAITAAICILRDVEIPLVMRTAQYECWGH